MKNYAYAVSVFPNLLLSAVLFDYRPGWEIALGGVRAGQGVQK